MEWKSADKAAKRNFMTPSPPPSQQTNKQKFMLAIAAHNLTFNKQQE